MLIYFILATGPSKVFKLLPWLVWGQLALDAFMFILWIAAAGTAKLNCNDYCKACSDLEGVAWNNLLCYCYDNALGDLADIFTRDTSPAPKGLGALLETRRSYCVCSKYSGSGSDADNGGKVATVAARTALNAIMVYAPLIGRIGRIDGEIWFG